MQKPEIRGATTGLSQDFGLKFSLAVGDGGSTTEVTP